MPTINIGGRKVKVGDEFLSLPPDQQDATVEEISRSFGDQTPDTPVEPKAPDVSTAADVAKSAGIGVVKGGIGLAGLAGDLTNLGAQGLRAADSYISGKLGMEPYQPRVANSALNAIPTSESITKGVEGVTGEFYKPQTTAGKYAQTAGEFLPGVIGGPGSLATKIAGRVLAPAIASEAAGQATEGTALEPWARAGGALASPALLAGGRRVVTPLPSDPARQRLVDILHGEGVTSLTAGQRTGNKTLQYAESVLGDAPGSGGAAARMQQEGQRQFTEAAMRRAGPNLADATPEVLASNNRRLGQSFEDLSARNTLVPDDKFISDVVDASKFYKKVPDSQQRAMVQGYIDDIVGHVNQGAIPGANYQEMRSRLSSQAKNLRGTDPTLSETLRDMRNALDNAMERSITPSDAGAWGATRREYAAQKTLENAASRAGVATAEGQITPANLRNSTAVQNRGAYVRGESDFSELARAGSGVMAPLPQSGTAPRVTMQALASMIGGVAGAGGGPAGAGLGAAAAAVAGPAAMGRVMMSRPVQKYLGNQVLQPGQNGGDLKDAIVRALLARREISTLPASQDSSRR